jgi:CHASE3 domain sensor protein
MLGFINSEGMLSSQSLNRCIDLLAQINSVGASNVRQMALEIGYILKQELDIVVSIEQAASGDRNPHSLDPKSMLQDNIQLFNENQKLLKENMELRGMLDSRVNFISSKVEEMRREIAAVNNNIMSIR